MLKTMIVIAVVLIGVVAAYAATRPDTFSVKRTTSIEAPPERIFALINDFHTWGAWSPYETKDFGMKKLLSGSKSGEGAVYEWDGDRNVGKGRMRITESSPPSKVTIALDMVKPFEAHNIVEFTLEGDSDATMVTWETHGPMPLTSKLVSLFIDTDRMIGNDFEAGLTSLKRLAEQ